MTIALIAAVALLGLLLVLVSFVQHLYLESLRLRPREAPAQAVFKQEIEARIGLSGDAGALPFSLIKHAGLVLAGIGVLGISASRHLGAGETIEACVMGLGLMLAATYVIPQTIYLRGAVRWLLPLIPVLKILTLLVKPLGAALTFYESVVKLSDPPPAVAEAPRPTDDIEALITAGTEEGIIEEDDRRLIHSVVALKDKTVRESMTPRPRMVAISVDRALEDLRQMVIHEQFSRIPVFEGTIDNIVGFVHVRDLFELTPGQQAQRTIRDLMRSVSYVPESKPVDDLLRDIQSSGTHMVIVVDEYGNTAGLVTMEDLMEEIVGEIRDEHEPDRDVRREDENTYVVAGSFDVDRLRELVNYRGQDSAESSTVGGLVTEWLGRVPQPGEKAERDGIRIEVLAGSDLRVEQVRVSRLEDPAHV